jgi:hypothetical protein
MRANPSPSSSWPSWMAGLNPAIQSIRHTVVSIEKLDGRLKGGHDEVGKARASMYRGIHDLLLGRLEGRDFLHHAALPADENAIG